MKNTFVSLLGLSMLAGCGAKKSHSINEIQPVPAEMSKFTYLCTAPALELTIEFTRQGDPLTDVFGQTVLTIFFSDASNPYADRLGMVAVNGLFVHLSKSTTEYPAWEEIANESKYNSFAVFSMGSFGERMNREADRKSDAKKYGPWKLNRAVELTSEVVVATDKAMRTGAAVGNIIVHIPVGNRIESVQDRYECSRQ